MMMSVNKPQTPFTYLTNNNRHNSTNTDSRPNSRANESDEQSRPNECVEKPNKSSKHNSTNDQAHPHLTKLSKMFRKISNIKAAAVRSESKRVEKQPKSSSRSENTKRPLITVIHKTVTKNNVKLFTSDAEDDEIVIDQPLIDVSNGDNGILHHHLSISHDRSDSSMNHSTHSNDYLSKTDHSDDGHHLSSLPIEHTATKSHLTGRKIEDVRSRSETKLTLNCQRKQPTAPKLKSESSYFLETQSKNYPIRSLNSGACTSKSGEDAHLNAKLYKKHLKQSRAQEELNLQAKKLIAESLVKSNRVNSNSEMSALLNASAATTDSNQVAGRCSPSNSNLNVPNNAASHKIPSYIGISCAISGYSTYSKYNSSESNSPASNGVRRLTDHTLAHQRNAANHNPNSLSVRASSATMRCGQPFLDTNNKIVESYSSFKNNLNKFDKLASHTHRATSPHLTNHLGSLNHSINTSTNHHHQFDSFDNSFLSKDRTTLYDSSASREDDDDNKSLVQKRIESLYGHNFASNWKDRFDRSKIKNEKVNNDSFRSPSCPPGFITNGLISSKKNLPVLKYIFNNSNSSHNNDSDLMKDRPKQHTKSEEAISLHSNKDDRSSPQSNDLNSLINDDDKLTEEECRFDQLDMIKEGDLSIPATGEDLLMPSIQDEQLFVPTDDDDLLTLGDRQANDLPKADKVEIGVDELDNIVFYPNVQMAVGREEERHDGRWHLKKVDNEIDKINERISEIEAICLDENLNSREEIDGKIRASVGKAHLLINKKLSQFKELCNKNINQTPDEQYKTLDKDLEGFYEMVSLQIDDINKTFDEIFFLKNNNWIVHNDLLDLSPRKPSSKSSSRTNSNVNSRNNSKPSSRNASKEDLRKLKLREAKRKHQQQQQADNEIVIFLPNNNKNEPKPDDL